MKRYKSTTILGGGPPGKIVQCQSFQNKISKEEINPHSASKIYSIGTFRFRSILSIFYLMTPKSVLITLIKLLELEKYKLVIVVKKHIRDIIIKL